MKTSFNSRKILLILICMSFLFCGKKKSNPYEVPNVTSPPENISSPARVELGKALYFDPRLSGSNWISCASCHNPALGWGDGIPTAIGHNFRVLDRNSPTIINTAFNFLQFWDGRAASLEEQATGPIESAGEMNQSLDELTQCTKYHIGFGKSFAV